MLLYVLIKMTLILIGNWSTSVELEHRGLVSVGWSVIKRLHDVDGEGKDDG